MGKTLQDTVAAACSYRDIEMPERLDDQLAFFQGD